MKTLCENCGEEIKGRVYRTTDDYELCADCYSGLKDEMAGHYEA